MSRSTLSAMPTDTDPLAGLPDHDPGDIFVGFADPIANPDLPWVVEPTQEEIDAVLLDAERLLSEPADVQVDVDADPDTGERFRTLAPCLVPGVNLRDYSKGPQARGFGSACSVKLATVVLANGARVTVDVRLAELIGLIMRANEAQGYIYRRADTGAYNCRKIAGTQQSSWHSWGIAVDGNWQTNPYTSPLRTDRPEWERSRWNRYGFAGGWDYTGRKDAMHTEWMGTVAQIALALELARRELAALAGQVGGTPGTPVPAPAPAPQPSDGYRAIDMGGVTELQTKGEQVRKDQADLIDTGFGVGSSGADGFAGPDTVAAIRGYQFAAGITVDGRMGDETRRSIHSVPSYPRNNTARAFQQRLRDRGWTQTDSRGRRVPLVVDGDFGTQSKKALRAFQAEKNLTADGLPGPQSWTALWTRPL